MFTLIILLLAICRNPAAGLIQNFNGSVDDQGVCHCSVVLPDSTFPADRLEVLEISNRDLSIAVEQQITTMQHYEDTMNVYLGHLVNLTKRVEEMEKGGLVYIELDFELVKLEIQEMEALIQQLKSSMNGTNAVVETLYQEIRNISIMVNQLEVYDKNNVLVIRREIAALKKQLEDCEKNQMDPMPPGSVPGNGTCLHGSIVDISKPLVVQLNYYGISYIYGGWGRDSLFGADQNLHWVSPLDTNGRTLYYVRTYNTYNDLLIYNQNLDVRVSSGQGSGMIMFNNSMYFNYYSSRDLCKYNPQLNKIETRITLPNAAYNNRFSYSSSAYQDIDMAADEEGLWAIYSTEEQAGNIVISRIDPISLVVQKTWITGQYKPAASNAFMVCGVLYVTRTINIKTEEIFYMYDTKTGKEEWFSIILEKPKENVQSLSYNPNDQKLYMYNDGLLLMYVLTFKPPQGGKSQI
ncbi:olfactomedin-4-like [Engystomops pustulosus]|uniref:olfactomedin-4-like n=1 Tax=Engystomops pustulosus TaxID=76066 RepID=UPI003AFAEF3E